MIENTRLLRCFGQAGQRLSENLLPITEVGKLRWPSLIAWYLLVNLFHLGLGNSKFWDDWHHYADVLRRSEVERKCPIDTCGKIPFVYLWEEPLLRIGVWTMHLLVVLIFLSSAYFYYRLLASLSVVSEWQRSLTTALFLLLPIYGARVSLVTVRASMMLFLMLAGADLLTKNRRTPTIVGLALIVFAGFLPSIRFFSLSILFALIVNDLDGLKRISARTKLIGIILFLAAMLHHLVLDELRVRIGLASSPVGYNRIEHAFLFRAVIVCTALAFPFLVKLLSYVARHRSLLGFRSSLVSVGMLLLAMASFPYMAVGHFPNISDWIDVLLPDNSDWNSRHQLLQGFGYSLVLTGMLQMVVRERQRVLVVTTLAACGVLSFSAFGAYYVDALKQRDVIAQLRQLADELDGVELLRFDDLALDVNARGRGVRDYEWLGMVKTAIDTDVEILEDAPLTGSCFAEPVGKIVEVRKVGSRLRTLLLRSPIVHVSIAELITCRHGPL